MYSRKISPAPEKIISHQKPVFGTFNSLPDKLDIAGVRAPFLGIPLPPIFSRLRIRGRLIYYFSFEDYIGSIDIFDNKIVNMAEISLWNKKNNVKYVYRIFLGLRIHLIPKKLAKAVCVSTARTRYIRIGWDHNQDRLSIKLKVKGDSLRPFVELSFLGRFSNEASGEVLSVKPAPTMRRCSATWYAFTPISGRMNFILKSGDLLESFQNKNGFGFLFENRSYYKFITSGENITACGEIDGKKIGFRLSMTSLDSVDTDSYNDNILFADGKTTTMPPVNITHPFGLAQNWIIQDIESMVDLTFTPKNLISRTIDIVAIKSSYNTIFGTLEGTLLDADGNKIILKDFPAIAKRSKLRL
ncbi:DUF2804 domain-containing protein [Treponema sp.]|uniref:DUF2804 family protein n=1 Tax=Treponema sp. TaxID=166 RepID=UPI00298E4BDD|nr:DUF2804 family protein [Treponema sp.]MCR5614055.1 DUF2804 domain-containing protein [Treponema sp.]